jgi:hypothetical protein
MGGQGSQLRRGFLHHGGIEGLEQAPRLVGEARNSASAPARRNRGRPGAQLGVGVEVERGAIAPPVPGEDRVGMERDVILQPFPDLGEQILEHVRIVMTVGPISTGPATLSRVRILPPGPGPCPRPPPTGRDGPAERGRQAADPGADDDDMAYLGVCAV